MPVTKRFVHFGLVLAISLFGFSIALLVMGASRSAINDAGLPGSTATDFHLKDITGHVVSLSEHRDAVHVLVISRVNSPQFARAVDRLQQLYQTFAKDQAVKIIGIGFDPSAGVLDSTATAPGSLSPKLTDLQTVFDFDGTVARAYRVSEMPTLFVIDGTGVIRRREALDDNSLSIATSEIIASLRRPTSMTLSQPADRLGPR